MLFQSPSSLDQTQDILGIRINVQAIEISLCIG